MAGRCVVCAVASKVDVDANEIQCPHSDYKKIPADLLATLRTAVKKAKRSDTGEVDHLPGAFLGFFIELLGDIKDHFEPVVLPTNQLSLQLNHESFFASKPKHFRTFLEALVMTQPFSQFMDQQIDEVLLKADMGNPDIVANPSFGK